MLFDLPDGAYLHPTPIDMLALHLSPGLAAEDLVLSALP
jgi:hypothetical protein